MIFLCFDNRAKHQVTDTPTELHRRLIHRLCGSVPNDTLCTVVLMVVYTTSTWQKRKQLCFLALFSHTKSKQAQIMISFAFSNESNFAGKMRQRTRTCRLMALRRLLKKLRRILRFSALQDLDFPLCSGDILQERKNQGNVLMYSICWLLWI